MRESKSLNSILRENANYKEQLPYERFLNRGPRALTDAELLAIIIRTGTSNITPMEIGSHILNMCAGYGEGLAGLCHLTRDDMMSVPGIGEVKAVKLMCIAELSKRIATSKALYRINFSSPRLIADYYMENMCHREREHCFLACLNNSNQLLCESELSIGTVNSTLLSPREVFVTALKHKAVNIVLVHNHPSGDPSPSDADEEMTERIKKVGELVNVKLLDHLIIGNHKYYSFAENKLI